MFFLSPFRFLFVTNKYLLSLGVQYYLQLLATVDLECKDGKTSESTSQSLFFFLYITQAVLPAGSRVMLRV